MSIDSNSPTFGVNVFDNPTGEGHAEPVDQSLKTNVVGYEHPFFSSNGSILVVNKFRIQGNTQEQELSGIVPQQVFQDISNAVVQTKVPFDILMFCCDWEQDLTSRSGASDATQIGNQLIDFVSQLRSSLGRDPIYAEVFMAFACNSASKVQTILQNAQTAPDDPAASAGTKKDNIVNKKLRNNNPTPRTNRELYDFFRKRMINGNSAFTQILATNTYTATT